MVALYQHGSDHRLTEWLRTPKRAFVETDATSATVRQVGAFGLGHVELPMCPDTSLNETRIESFVVDLATRAVTPIGDDHELIEAFMPAVTQFVDAIGAALDAEAIETQSGAFLTVAFTPRSEIAGEPHVDDGDFQPDAGPGLVAVAGSHHGLRVCCDDLPAIARPGLPLELDAEAVADFGAGRLAQQQAKAGEVVLMPQFGQLHAGPDLRAEPGPPRSLLVLRAQVPPVVG